MARAKLPSNVRCQIMSLAVAVVGGDCLRGMDKVFATSQGQFKHSSFAART